MRLVLHQKVYSDIDKIMEYYEQLATPDLADEFYAELRQYMKQAAERKVCCSD
jgi:plasmid stabilization system protein ParE